MDVNRFKEYYELLEYELVQALGCTEPSAVAYASACAVQLLGCKAQRLELKCSGSIIKNVHSVSIPNGEELKGTSAAAILGALIGDGEKKLCLLEDLTDEMIEETRMLCDTDFCLCKQAKDVDGVYIEVKAYAGEKNAEIIIAGTHTNIVMAKYNGEIKKEGNIINRVVPDKSSLSVEDIIFFAENCDIEKIAPLLDRQIENNYAIAMEGLQGKYGINIGRNLLSLYDSDDVRIRMCAKAAAGSDARMSGCVMPVVINSGSGNQGITISLPIIEYANEIGAQKEKLYRALALGNLIAILQKRTMGNLSAFCGVVHAAAGAACGVAYLMGGRYEHISNIITYTLGTIGGMVCDGAKASCAAKIRQALDAALMGLQISFSTHESFKSGDGLVKDDVEKTIESFGRMGRYGMKRTGEEILDIMLEAK